MKADRNKGRKDYQDKFEPRDSADKDIHVGTHHMNTGPQSIATKSGVSRDPVFIKVEKRMQDKQDQLKDHISKVENNTLDIGSTTAALKNRTEELAAKQDEILKQIMLMSKN